MADTTYIYGLIDPRTQELRYIGKANNLRNRLEYHVWQRGHKTHRGGWIRRLFQLGLRPEIFIIEEVPRESWQESERFWINYFKYIGSELTNATDGGEGGLGFRHTDETRKKMSARNTGRTLSKEHRRRISETRKKRYPVLDSNTKAKISRSLSGHPNWSNKFIVDNPMKDPDVKAKMSNVLKGRVFTDEWLANLSSAHKGSVPWNKGKKTGTRKSKSNKVAGGDT